MGSGKHAKNNLQVLREEKGISREKFSKKFHISEDSLKNYEKSNRRLPIELAIDICDKYKVSLDWMFCVDDKMKNDTMEQVMLALRKVISIGKEMTNEGLVPVLLINKEFANYLDELRYYETILMQSSYIDMDVYNAGRKKIFDEYKSVLTKLDENATFIADKCLSVRGIKSSTAESESDTILTYLRSYDLD
ncbi:MAG: helix-turn-helix domain-containing protein [Erysipelotrichaceae bacterium]